MLPLNKLGTQGGRAGSGITGHEGKLVEKEDLAMEAF